MTIPVLLRRLAGLCAGSAVLSLIMAPGCPMPVPIGPKPQVIDVVLVNNTQEVIPPLLYADPRTLFVPQDIMFADNLVDIGPPLVPGEIVTVTLACGDAGSLLSDADLVELADGTVLDSTLLRQNQHYYCGEEVIMYYEPLVVPPPVTVELVNDTSNFVDAFFWSDPGTVFDPDAVAIPANFIDVGPPLAPGELVTITLECVDAGTFLADADLLLEPAGALPSENLVLLNEGTHFLCGDIVSFYYEVDGAGIFFISADVNDFTIAP